MTGRVIVINPCGKTGDVAAIIPIFFPEVLSAHKNEFPGILIPLDSPEKIKLLDNKSSACALAAELGIPQPLVQEYIEGENVCVDTLRCPDGGFYAAAYRVLEPKGKGVSTLRAPADEPELSAICGKMLEHIDYHGICGFDFRRSITGETYFLEANPRFSGGLETTLASGLDLPWLLLHTQRF